MTASEARIREAALAYNTSLRSFRAGKISADQHRTENRRIRSGLTEMEWEQAKFRVLNQL